MPAPKVTQYDQTVAEVSLSGDSVVVKFRYHPENVKRIKRVPSWRFIGPDKKEGPGWRIDLDLPTMRKLREQFGDELNLGPELKAWGHRQTQKERNLNDLSDANDAKLKNISAKLAKWLRPYQRADVRFMAETNVINANQPRVGKTPSTIAAIIEAQLEWGWHLVFAPVTSLRNVWEDEIKHVYKLQGLDEPTVLTGDSPDERREAIKQAKGLAAKNEAFWLVLNPAMGRLKRVKVEGTDGDEVEFEEELVHPELAEVEWDSITVDEFHLMGLSNPTTMGARGINEIANTTQPARRYALSGTPMRGKPVKLWGALHFLEPQEFTSRWNWARHWLIVKSGDSGAAIEGIMPGREVDFYEHLKSRLVRRTRREALPGLPPTQVVDVWCDMTVKQAEQYQVFATEAEWRLSDAEEEGRLTATNILAEYMRLKQFADAYCEVHKTGKESAEGIPELKVQQTEDSGKLLHLIEKLREENVITKDKDDDDPKFAVVYSQFNPMVAMVANYLKETEGIETAVIDGSVTGADRNGIVKAFQTQKPFTYKKGKKEVTAQPARVLVMNVMSGGASITLDRAETVHILDESWTPDDQEQAADRIVPTTKERQKRLNIGVYYYRTKGTIEEYIQKLVADKALNNRTILDLRRKMQIALKASKDELKRGRELIAEHGGISEALHATHPDHGGDAEDFRAVMVARMNPGATKTRKGQTKALLSK